MVGGKSKNRIFKIHPQTPVGRTIGREGWLVEIIGEIARLRKHWRKLWARYHWGNARGRGITGEIERG